MSHQPSDIQLYTPAGTPPSEIQSLAKPSSRPTKLEYPQLMPHQNAPYDPNSDASIVGLKLTRADSTSSWASSVAYPPTPDSTNPHTSASTPVVTYELSRPNSSMSSYDNTSSSFITVETMLPDVKNLEGKYPCSICTKSYKHTKHLRRHMMRHTGERPFGCDCCNSRFSRADVRKRHVEKCRARFELEANIKDTVRSVAPSFVSVSAVQMYREDDRPERYSSRSGTSTGSNSPYSWQYPAFAGSIPPAGTKNNLVHFVPAPVPAHVPMPAPVPAPVPAQMAPLQPVPVHDARWRAHQQFIQFPNLASVSPQLGTGQFPVASPMENIGFNCTPTMSAFPASNSPYIYQQQTNNSPCIYQQPTTSNTFSHPMSVPIEPIPTPTTTSFAAFSHGPLSNTTKYMPSPPLKQGSTFYEPIPIRTAESEENLRFRHHQLPPPPTIYEAPQMNFNTVTYTPTTARLTKPARTGQLGLGIYVNDPLE